MWVKLVTIVSMFTVVLFVSSCGQAVSTNGDGTSGSGSSSLMLSWNAPTTNTDGTPLTDLAGYKLYYGTKPGQYDQVLTVGSFTTAEIDGLYPGTTYYLAVTAYDIFGNESDFSNEINYTVL